MKLIKVKCKDDPGELKVMQVDLKRSGADFRAPVLISGYVEKADGYHWRVGESSSKALRMSLPDWNDLVKRLGGLSRISFEVSIRGKKELLVPTNIVMK